MSEVKTAEKFYDEPVVRWATSGTCSYPSKMTIIGETSRSWLTGYRWKPHKTAKKDTVFISDEQAAKIIWARQNDYKIAQAVERADAEILIKIAELIGFPVDLSCPAPPTQRKVIYERIGASVKTYRR